MFSWITCGDPERGMMLKIPRVRTRWIFLGPKKLELSLGFKIFSWITCGDPEGGMMLKIPHAAHEVDFFRPKKARAVARLYDVFLDYLR